MIAFRHLLLIVLLHFGTIAGAAPHKAPTVSLTAPAAGSTFAAPATITLSATAKASSGTIAKVEFYQGSSLLGAAAAAPYNFVWTGVTAGTYALTAKAVDSAGATKTSSAISITVTGPKLLISTPAAGSIIYASSVTVSGTFFGDQDTTVLVDNGNTSRVAGINGNSFSATLPVALGANTLRVVATRRDRTFDQAMVTITGNAPPLLVFTSPSTTLFESSESIAFAVDAASPSGTIAKVDFLRGSTLLGSASAPPFRYTWSNPPQGSHTITARATDGNGVTSVAVLGIQVSGPNQAPIVALTSPANGAGFTAPGQIPIAASISDPDGSISLVEFLANGNVIGTTNLSPYAMTWSGVGPGSYSLTARATDDRAAVATSASVSVVVATPNSPPSVAITAPLPGTQYVSSATVNLAATASDADGTVAKVDYYANATLVGTVQTLPYAFAWANVAAGTYSLVAKATDNAGLVASSSPVSISVNQNTAPIVSLTVSGAGTARYAPATITLTATASDPDGTISRVDFYHGSTLIGTATAPPYALTWSDVPAGSYVVTAKAIDNAGASGSSNAIPIAVAPLYVVIDTPADGAMVAGESVTVSGTLIAPANSGLIVGDVLAAIEPGGVFQAAGVRLVAGANTVTATLTTPDGETRAHSINVSSSGPGPIEVTVHPTQGIAPLPVLFNVIAAEGVAIQKVEIDGDTDGLIDYTVTEEPWEGTLTFGGVGTSMATVRVTDTGGNVHTSVTPIVLLSESALDQTIRAVWNGFKAALAAGDKAQAMQYMGPLARDRYSGPFDTLASLLPQIVASFSELQLVTLSSELGEYAINRVINGEDRIFFIHFGQDGDGVWRLQSM